MIGFGWWSFAEGVDKGDRQIIKKNGAVVEIVPQNLAYESLVQNFDVGFLEF